MPAKSRAFTSSVPRSRGQRRQQVLGDGGRGRHVHRGREHVVRGLAHVDVVVRVQQARFAALAAHQLGAAVGQHLVHVHVALGARAGLPDRQRELARMASLQHFVGGAHDGVGLVLRQLAERAVDRGGGALDLGQRGHQFRRHFLGRNVEVVQRALGLRSPQLAAGTSIGPKLSFSILFSMTHPDLFVSTGRHVLKSVPQRPLMTLRPRILHTMLRCSVSQLDFLSSIAFVGVAWRHGPRAAELGEARVSSHIGQPLVADIELSDDRRPRHAGLRCAWPVPRSTTARASPCRRCWRHVNLSVMKRDGRQFLHVTSLRAGRCRAPAPVPGAGRQGPAGGAPGHAVADGGSESGAAGARAGTGSGTASRIGSRTSTCPGRGGLATPAPVRRASLPGRSPSLRTSR
jgi:hypothetical protein